MGEDKEAGLHGLISGTGLYPPAGDQTKILQNARTKIKPSKDSDKATYLHTVTKSREGETERERGRAQALPWDMVRPAHGLLTWVRNGELMGC